MPQAMIMPKKYFFDKDGNPLAFGKIYTYQAGTVINKPTYTTEAGDVANSNPIILNGEGYADIYLDGSYDIVVDDAEDNNIWTAEPVSSNVVEEWNNCTSVTYLSPTTFKMTGNHTGKFDVGRGVRIDNGVSLFVYSTIKVSSFAGGETTITVTDGVVGVGANTACTSIVGRDSIPIRQHVDDIFGLLAVANKLDGDMFSVFGYFFQAPVAKADGGGDFVWQSGVSKGLADGVLVFDPDNTGGFDGTHSTLASFLNAQGSGGGSGCYVRLSVDTLTPEHAGAIGDGVLVDTEALASCHATQKSISYTGGKTYVIDETNRIEIFDGCEYSGSGSTIIAVEGTTTTDPGDGFGRFNNNVFYRNSTDVLSGNLIVRGYSFDIKEAKINAVGGGTIPTLIRDSSVGAVRLFDNYFSGDSTPSGQGGPSVTGFNSGAFCQVDGYPLMVYSNEIEDGGNGIVGENCKFVKIYDNIIRFCGVSRDFTSWSNVASILVRGSGVIDIHDNFSFVTGGSSFFVSVGSSDNDATTETVSVIDNKIIGSGLSAISAGVRTSVTTKKTIDSITVNGNSVIGWCCAIDSSQHQGVKIAIEDGNSSKVVKVDYDGYVDYLAPWEEYNNSTNSIDGSYNTNKTVGSDVGTQYGVLISADSIDGISTSNCTGEVRNHQRIGFGFSFIDKNYADVSVYNCGWSRDGLNAPYQIQQSVSCSQIKTQQLKASISHQSQGCNASAAFCAPLRFIDVEDNTIDIMVTESGNQDKTIRLDNDIAGYKLKIKSIVSDAILNDAGYINFIDTSAGSNTNDTEIEWSADKTTALYTGSRILPAGIGLVMQPYTDGSARTLTLKKASFYKGSRITFSSGLGVLTIDPASGETIDGATGSFVIPQFESRDIYSDGSEWFVMG